MSHAESAGVAEAEPRTLQAAAPAPAAEEFSQREPSPGLLAAARNWLRLEGAWWASSFVFHMLLMCVLMLVGTKVTRPVLDEAPSFEEAEVDTKAPPPPPERFEVGDAPLEPTELSTDTLSMSQPGQLEQAEEYNDDSPEFTPRGGGVAAITSGPSLGGIGGFDIGGVGPGLAVRGAGGVGVGVGTGTHAGAGGSGTGFGTRGTGMRKAMVGSFGGTKQGERAVGAALNWLARHQNPDGSWSLSKYRTQCKDPTCTGTGTADADAGATALGLLPFLAAGQTHMPKDKGPYRNHVYRGLYWLMRGQTENGDLAGNAPQKMYSQGLAAITLCEAYGLTGDRTIRLRAQRAVDFIQSAQNPTTGGWRYIPGEEGDTSVVGWQVMALKSAQMAGLSVRPQAFEGAKRWLKSASKGNGGLFSYLPESGPTPAMTAVGLLCCQYMGTRRGDPVLTEGTGLLLNNLPDNQNRDLYYWYYATQVLHNLPGPDWDNWNRKMRKALIETQCKEGCATGSWDPEKPAKDKWGDHGGRLMETSLAALTLEVYYRYLPLYKLDREDAASPPEKGGAAAASSSGKGGAAAAKAPAEKPAPAAKDAPAEKKPSARKPK